MGGSARRVSRRSLPLRTAYAAHSLVVAGMLVRASLQNVIKPIQSILDYSPAPSPQTLQAIDEALPKLSHPVKLLKALIRVESGRSVAVVRLAFDPSTPVEEIAETKRELHALLDGQLTEARHVEIEAVIDF
jgi:divalent metal cation (Fe/Co/Zn/Cd) transporter